MTTYLLTADIGNSHTVIGLFNGADLSCKWRIRTNRGITCDELAAQLSQMLALHNISFSQIAHTVLASVVPASLNSWQGLSRRYLGDAPLIVADAANVRMPILCTHPYEVGADRLVNALAAYAMYGSALIIIDYGTATTFDCVSSRGEYLGGAIAPGLSIAADALTSRTSKLPGIDLFSTPETVLGRDTTSAMQSGFIYGFAGLTDGILQRLIGEFDTTPEVLATGGLAPVIVPHCSLVRKTEPDLTLEGLRLVFEHIQKNRE